MNYRSRLIFAVLLFSGMVIGCSSSSGTQPEADRATTTAGASTAGAGTEGAGTNGESIDLNGDYDVIVLLDEASTVIPECGNGEGTLTVTGTTLTGIVDDLYIVSGTIASDGTITGGFALSGGSTFADFEGMLDGAALVGTWSDIRGCSGTWRADKE